MASACKHLGISMNRKISEIYLYWCLSKYQNLWIHLCITHTVTSLFLSHNWVWYPEFWGHGVKCPILTTVVPGFSGDLISCTSRSKWGPFGDLYLARKNLFCVWNKLFLGEIKFSQRRTRPVKSSWWQIVSMQESTNEWKNLTIFGIMGLAETQW